MDHEKKNIFTLVGEPAAGKSEVARYLIEKHGAEAFRFSAPLADALKVLSLPANRENMSVLSTHLREAFGEDILARIIANNVALCKKQVVVVDGARRDEDIRYVRDSVGFLLVFVEAPLEVRFERLRLRGEKTDDATKTLEEFRKDHELEAESAVLAMREKADVVIDNSGDRSALHAQIDTLLQKCSSCD